MRRKREEKVTTKEEKKGVPKTRHEGTDTQREREGREEGDKQSLLRE